MCALKEIWYFISDNKTASVITFLAFLFTIFTWLYSRRDTRKRNRDFLKAIVHINGKKLIKLKDEKAILKAQKMLKRKLLAEMLPEEFVKYTKTKEYIVRVFQLAEKLLGRKLQTED